MEPGESLEETARREVWEETGVKVGSLRFLMLLSGPGFFHTYPNGDQAFFVSAVYEGTVAEGSPRGDGVESSEAAFCSVDQLPASGSDTVYRAILERLRAG
jgi:8-oxo-dGTP pyrophosphatase MutT (NUDIX family)